MIKKFIQNDPQITLPYKICINFLLCSCKCLFKISNICFFGNLQIKYYNNNEIIMKSSQQSNEKK